jgi:hypothetical protein
MADVLSVIADIIKQDKQQKREHNKVMREVQKKMKEKEVSEEDGPGDGDEYQKFVRTMLKKFGVKSPSELAPDKKKEFYDALDAGWEGDDEKPEPEDEQMDLGARVKARMEADDDSTVSAEVPAEDDDEDEDDDPVGDPDEDEADEDDDEDMDEPSEEQIDKIADLVVQKLKDKAEDEADEEEEPESTEAEAGEEEEIDTKPKVEGTIHRNPHHRGMWEEALRKVYEEKVPEPIPEIIKSVGKELRDYALKSGGIDKNDFLKISDVMQKGKMPKAASINRMDTDPREFVFDLMAKTMGWKYVEQYGGIRFQHRRDYVESFQGGHVLQEHCGECGAMDHVDEKFKKGKYTVRDGNTGKVIATYSSGEKASKEMHKLLDSGKYSDLEVKMEEVEIEEVRMPEGLNKEGAAEFMAAASAAKKQGKKKFKFGDKEYPVTIKIDIPTEETDIDEKMKTPKYANRKTAAAEKEARLRAQRKRAGLDESDKAMMMKLTTKAMKAIPNSPDQKELIKQVNVYRKKLGMKPMKEEVEIDEAKGEFEVKYASSKRGPIKVSKFNTLDDAKKFLAQVKGEGMNGIISKGGKPIKEKLDDEDTPTVKKVVKMLKKASQAHAGQADELEKSMKEHHQKDANGEPIPHDDEEDLSEARKETPAEFLKRGGKIKKVKAGMGKEGKKRVADFKKSFKKTKAKEDELDAKEREEREKNNEETVHEAWIDTDARKVQSKWKKMDKKAKKKWMDGVMAKAKKEGMPKDELMDVLDDYGLVEGTMTGKDSDSIEGPAKGMKHKCPTHVKKEGFGYGKNISHTVSENIVDKMNIYWFDSQEVSVMMPTSEVEIVSEGYHSMKNHREKFKSTNRIAEGYMVLPAMDRNKYTPMRGMEGPFPTMSGKVLYYDPKAGQYYDRDSDMYISYDQYMEYDKMSPSQRKQMDMGPLGDPKSKEYKAMERIKNKAEKMAKKNRLKAKNESIGMNFIRKHYQKNDE